MNHRSELCFDGQFKEFDKLLTQMLSILWHVVLKYQCYTYEHSKSEIVHTQKKTNLLTAIVIHLIGHTIIQTFKVSARI